ncbi:MAG: hypothetical protein KAJ19_26580 [Gammaproteobacteria bacterium]|nr:hypothetical protein [Gammaproteobacteria bacterium]
MKKIIMAVIFALMLATLTGFVCFAATLPVTSFNCEVSDTSPDNVFSWDIIRGEARWFQTIYYQDGVVMDLSDADPTNAYLYLKASDSSNVYQIVGSVYTDPTNGIVRILWASTNAVPAALYNMEFAVPDLLNINLASRGKLRVKDGTGSGVETNTPFYPTLVTKIIAGTGVSVTPAGGTGEVTVNATGGSLDSNSTSWAGADILITTNTAGTVNEYTVNVSVTLREAVTNNSTTGELNRAAIALNLISIGLNSITGELNRANIAILNGQTNNYAYRFLNNNFTGTNNFINTVIFGADSFFDDSALHFLNDSGVTNVTVGDTSSPYSFAVNNGDTLLHDTVVSGRVTAAYLVLTNLSSTITNSSALIDGTNFYTRVVPGSTSTNIWPVID